MARADDYLSTRPRRNAFRRPAAAVVESCSEVCSAGLVGGTAADLMQELAALVLEEQSARENLKRLKRSVAIDSFRRQQAEYKLLRRKRRELARRLYDLAQLRLPLLEAGCSQDAVRREIDRTLNRK